jgi:hypothetical protein
LRALHKVEQYNLGWLHYRAVTWQREKTMPAGKAGIARQLKLFVQPRRFRGSEREQVNQEKAKAE